MKLKFRESQIEAIAQRYEYAGGDDAVVELGHRIQEQCHLTRKQLKAVAKWKATRSAGNVDKNSSGYVKEITAFALSAKDERSRIESLTMLDGVGWPTASVLLHFFHNQPYPILDYRALWSCGLDVPTQYSFSFWWPYVNFCRDVAKRSGVSMRVLDRALWQYSKERQK